MVIKYLLNVKMSYEKHVVFRDGDSIRSQFNYVEKILFEKLHRGHEFESRDVCELQNVCLSFGRYQSDRVMEWNKTA